MQAPPTIEPEKQNVHAMKELKASELEKAYQTLEKTVEPPQERNSHRRKK